MNFRPELAEKVMSGEKTVTRRLVSDNPRSPWFIGGCSLVVGRTYAVCPGRGKNSIGRVRIVSVTQEALGYLTDAEAMKEGFTRVDGLSPAMRFERAWRDINGTYDRTALVYRVEMDRVREEARDAD